MGHFASFSEFIQMGNHGLYVWSSYGLTLAVILYNILAAYFARRRFFNTAKRRLRRESRSS